VRIVSCQNWIVLEQMFLSDRRKIAVLEQLPSICGSAIQETAPRSRASYVSGGPRGSRGPCGWRTGGFGDGNSPWHGWRSRTGAAVPALLGSDRIGSDGTGRRDQGWGKGKGRGNGNGWCGDSLRGQRSRLRGPALASVTFVSLNDNERARVSQLFL
jgi:hypothetical protein